PPDGQGWPPPTESPRSGDLPPGYQPMPQYPAAGQPGYPASDPTYPSTADPAQGFVPAPALPSYPPSVYPPSPTFPQASAYRSAGAPGPARESPAPSAGAPSSPAPSAPAASYRTPMPYEDATPLFDQQPPPPEPPIDWTMPSYPTQWPPSDALTTDTPI